MADRRSIRKGSQPDQRQVAGNPRRRATCGVGTAAVVDGQLTLGAFQPRDATRSGCAQRGQRRQACSEGAAIVGGTGAGLDIDIAGQVLDTHGRAIPGLFAAGETLGVVQGKRDAGGGMYIASAIILGRQAGRSAASLRAAEALAAERADVAA